MRVGRASVEGTGTADWPEGGLSVSFITRVSLKSEGSDGGTVVVMKQLEGGGRAGWRDA